MVVPGLLDFFMYCIVSNISDIELYGLHKIRKPVLNFVFNYLQKQQNEIIELMKTAGNFTPPTPIAHTMNLIKDFMGFGTKMGEGWLLPAEMLELNDEGVHNIVCTQPFGCLPNHICGKGMMKPLKEKNPDMNIVAIDYDSGASKVNQENRIKLMLANARADLAEKNRENNIKTEEKAYAEAEHSYGRTEIPQNTGNVARTCAATGARLHLVGPMGFSPDDKKLKRAGLDYWHFLDITYYDSLEDFFSRNDGAFFYFTTKGRHTHSEVSYPDNCYLLFGKETKGLPERTAY